ncbi:hypothetical protein DP939_00465 [Spongiactinospora rosea]|uniref:Signal transduction histidine kinase n=1 Tax=Spongiactinospora rosea TaxID=2248750 RepID=A0A366M4X1_9ACTN|nr:hypothetical protein [Spongiactinospora rosea]RBQ21241.1 hypothetical protein DP939_00465 [Spongiactinospora rosea]
MAAVARRYAEGGKVAAVLIAAAWHLGFDLTATLGNWSLYQPRTAVALAWAAYLVIAAAAGYVLLFYDRAARLWWVYGGAALVLDVVVMAATAPDHILGAADWGWGSIGWLGVLVLWWRRFLELIAFLAANALLMLGALAVSGALDPASLAKYLMVIAGSAALQLGYSAGAHALEGDARTAVALSEARAAVITRTRTAEAVHADRLERQAAVREIATELLTELARGAAPDDEDLRARCAIAASRLRRLISESEDVPDPLENDMLACALDAERRGVRITLHRVGEIPPLPADVRRALVEPPAEALARARPRTHARLVIAATAEEVAVSVLVEGQESLRIPDGAGAASRVEFIQDITEEGLLWVRTQWTGG